MSKTSATAAAKTASASATTPATATTTPATTTPATTTTPASTTAPATTTTATPATTTAPASTTTTTTVPPVNQINIGTINSPNPALWVDAMTLGTPVVNYLIQTTPPGGSWFYVNQFCSLLTTCWLNDPNVPLTYGIQALSSTVQVSMAGQLIGLSSLQDQVTEAANSIAHSSTLSSVTALAAALPGYPAGTRIWAGNNNHVLGFIITAVANATTGAPGTYTAYDSNYGRATTGNPTTGLVAQLTGMNYTDFVIGAP